MDNQLVLSMAFYVLYIGVLGVFLFKVRANAVRSGQVSIKFFKTHTGSLPPERVHVISRHYDNQFQAPLVFLIGGSVHLAMGSSNLFTVILAWSFIATRLAHSLIFLGRNNVLHRVSAFALGWVVLLIFWGQIAWISF